MRYLYLCLLALLAFHATAQDKPLSNEQLAKRLDSTITENRILKERIENVAATNDKVLNLIYFVAGGILTLILGLTIWNNVASYRISNSRIKNIEERLAAENTVTIENYLKENLDKKIKSNASSFEGKIEGLKFKILKVEIELLKRSIRVKEMVSYGPNEAFSLVDLLEKSILVYDQTTLEYDVKETLEAIAAFLKKYPDLDSYHRDNIIQAIRKVNHIEFKHYVDEIKDILKIRE